MCAPCLVLPLCPFEHVALALVSLSSHVPTAPCRVATLRWAWTRRTTMTSHSRWRRPLVEGAVVAVAFIEDGRAEPLISRNRRCLCPQLP